MSVLEKGDIGRHMVSANPTKIGAAIKERFGTLLNRNAFHMRKCVR